MLLQPLDDEIYDNCQIGSVGEMKHEKFIYEKLALKKSLRYAATFAIMLQIIFIWSTGLSGSDAEIDDAFLNETNAQLEVEAVALLMEGLEGEEINDLYEAIENSEEFVDNQNIEVEDGLVLDDEVVEQEDELEAEMPDIEERSNNASIRVHQMQGNYNYLSGEIIQLHVGASLDGVFSAGTVFEIRIPRLHITDSSFQASAISGQVPPTITRTGNATTGEFIVRYTLNVVGGLEFDAPIQMSTPNGATPNGFQIPVTARLIDASGNDLADNVETIFTINTITPEVAKYVLTHTQTTWSWSADPNVLVGNSGLENVDQPGYLSEDLRELALVNFVYHLNSPGAFGNRTYGSLVFYDRIPDEALFLQSVNPGWTFDEETRIARFDRNVQTTLGQIGQPNSVPLNIFNPNLATQPLSNNSPILRLYFPGAPINETLTNEVRVVGTGQGSDCAEVPSDCFEVFDELNFRLGVDTRRFNGTISKTPSQTITGTNNVAVRGNVVLGDNTRNISTNDDTRDYTITIGHTVTSGGGSNFVHLPQLPMENVVIRDHSLNPSLYFRGITISARTVAIFDGTLEVSVLLTDGTTEILADDLNITTTQHIDFSDFSFDPMEITEFFVRTTEGSYIFPGTSRLAITVHTGPRDPTEVIVPEDQAGRAFTNDVTLIRNTLNHVTASANARGTLAYRRTNPLVGINHSAAQLRTAGSTTLPGAINHLNWNQYPFLIGQTRHFRLDVNMHDILTGDVVETDKILVLLPNGLEFIPNSVELHLANTIQTNMGVEDLTDGMEVIDDFQGTGQTALIFHLQPFTSITDTGGTPANPVRAFSIVYEVTVTEGIDLGVHTGIAHLLWLNRDEVLPGVLPTNSAGGSQNVSYWVHRRFIVSDRFDLTGTGATDQMLSEAQARFNVIPPLREISLVKITPRSNHLSLTNFLNNEITYHLNISTRGMLPGDVIETNVIVDLLPVGMEFVQNSQSISMVAGQAQSSMTNASIAPDVIPNFMGTGRTAVIFPLQNLTINPALSYHEAAIRNAFQITYRVRITSLAQQGENMNEVYLSWLNRDVMFPGVSLPPQIAGIGSFSPAAADVAIVPDIWNLNQTGSPDNTIVRSRTTIDYSPPYELLMFKEVRGNLDSNFLTYPAIGMSELGSYVDYRLRLLNNSPGDIHPTNFQVIDILPHAGDSRGSTFTPTLSGPIIPPTGYRVYYTTDAVNQVNSITTFVANANWVTSVANYEDVTAIRFEMNEGHILERESQIAFDIRLNLPTNPNLTADDRAVNMFYTSTNGGVSYILSNEARIRFLEYRVDGYVFHDLDGNSVLDRDVNNIFANHLVELLRQTEMGYEVIATTMTDARGFYSFNTIYPGHYFIRVHAPTGLTPITYNIGGPYGANAFDPTTARSEGFTFDLNNTHHRINAAFEGGLTPPITGLSTYTLSIGLLLSILVIGTIYVTLRAKKYSKQYRIIE